VRAAIGIKWAHGHDGRCPHETNRQIVVLHFGVYSVLLQVLYYSPAPNATV